MASSQSEKRLSRERRKRRVGPEMVQADSAATAIYYSLVLCQDLYRLSPLSPSTEGLGLFGCARPFAFPSLPPSHPFFLPFLLFSPLSFLLFSLFLSFFLAANTQSCVLSARRICIEITLERLPLRVVACLSPDPSHTVKYNFLFHFL